MLNVDKTKRLSVLAACVRLYLKYQHVLGTEYFGEDWTNEQASCPFLFHHLGRHKCSEFLFSAWLIFLLFTV